jgi:hypothetical protein
MSLGLELFTLLHVVLSLVGIAAGLVVCWAYRTSQRLEGLTRVFLSSTIATSVTGFFFPFEGLRPSHVFGVISLLVLAVACVALYRCGLCGRWRWAYVLGSMIALYLNTFVLVVQVFLKVPGLQTGGQGFGPAFAIVQAVVLVVFIAWTVLAIARFRPESRGGAVG